MGAGDLRGKSFRENRRPAPARPTPKTPDGKGNPHLAAMSRKVCQSAPITAVHPPREPAATRTRGCGAPRIGVDDNTVSRQLDTLNSQVLRLSSFRVSVPLEERLFQFKPGFVYLKLIWNLNT